MWPQWNVVMPRQEERYDRDHGFVLDDLDGMSIRPHPSRLDGFSNRSWDIDEMSSRSHDHDLDGMSSRYHDIDLDGS